MHEITIYTQTGKTSDTADWARIEPPCSEVAYWATVFANNVLYNISNPSCAYVCILCWYSLKHPKKFIGTKSTVGCQQVSAALG